MSSNAALRLLCLSLLGAFCLAACDRGGPAAGSAGSGSAAETAPAGPANVPPPTQPDFDPATVPESTATLPPFPFFKAPDGQESVLGDRDRNADFDREHMIAGNKIVAIEGKVARSMYSLDATDLRRYTAIAFQRNYENAILALGGVKISKTAYTDAAVDAFGGRELLDKHYHGTCAGIDCDNNTYLLRQGNKEYWVQVSTGAIPLHGYIVVLQREGMKQSVGFLDASAMKKAIDAHGRVALHINFDVDKATLRPDAQPLLEEINKMLNADPALKLSIEGHTDNNGTATHNQELSTARARSVLGALIGLGIDPSRLQSRGFGQGQPIADNGSEAGRTKNRRVELVRQ
ncbi:MAG: OmpA family protein [Lysobacteraceae bacterium]